GDFVKRVLGRRVTSLRREEVGDVAGVRDATFLSVCPSAVNSASTQGNRVPNRFDSLSRRSCGGGAAAAFPAPGLPAPGNVGSAGCIASYSFAEISRSTAQTFVGPKRAPASAVGLVSWAAASRAAETLARSKQMVRSVRPSP